MNLKIKILHAINNGLNEALNLDDFSEDDLKIQKKSLSSIIKDSNYKNSIQYYQEELYYIMDNFPFIDKSDIQECIDIYEKYRVQYNPQLDGKEFKEFIHTIVEMCGNNVNLNWINTSDVTDMSNLFNYDKDADEFYYYKISQFNGDISKWDVSNVRNMEDMFRDSDFNGDISNWDVSNVQNISSMFMRSSFNQNICNWNIKKGCDTYRLFTKCPIKEEYKTKGIEA